MINRFNKRLKYSNKVGILLLSITIVFSTLFLNVKAAVKYDTSFDPVYAYNYPTTSGTQVERYYKYEVIWMPIDTTDIAVNKGNVEDSYIKLSGVSGVYIEKTERFSRSSNENGAVFFNFSKSICVDGNTATGVFYTKTPVSTIDFKNYLSANRKFRGNIRITVRGVIKTSTTNYIDTPNSKNITLVSENNSSGFCGLGGLTDVSLRTYDYVPETLGSLREFFGHKIGIDSLISIPKGDTVVSKDINYSAYDRYGCDWANQTMTSVDDYQLKVTSVSLLDGSTEEGVEFDKTTLSGIDVSNGKLHIDNKANNIGTNKIKINLNVTLYKNKKAYFNYTASKTITLVASEYDVTYDTGPMSSVVSQKIAHDNSVTLPSSLSNVPSGYKFVGWQKNGSGDILSGSQKITADTTFKAIVQPIVTIQGVNTNNVSAIYGNNVSIVSGQTSVAQGTVITVNPGNVASADYKYDNLKIYHNSNDLTTQVGWNASSKTFTMPNVPITIVSSSIAKEENNATVIMSGYNYGESPTVPKISNDNYPIDKIKYYYSRINSNQNGTLWNNMTSTSLDAGEYYMYAVLEASDVYKSKTTEPIKFTISPRLLNVIPDGLTKKYGQTDPILTYSFSNQIEGHVPGFNGSLTRASGETVGDYSITAGNLKLVDNGLFKTINYKMQLDTTKKFSIIQANINDVAIQSVLPNGKNDWYINSSPVLQAPSGYTISVNNSINSTWSSSINTDNTDGENKTLTYYLKASDGTISQAKNVIYSIDSQAPTDLKVSYEKDGWKEFMNQLTLGLFFRETVKVKISASDSISGVNEYKYSYNDVEYVKTADSDGTYTFNVDPQFKGKISNVSAIDAAGNIGAKQSTNDFIIDNINPTDVSVNTNDYTSDEWTKDDVVVTVSGSTAYSGIEKYQYSIDGTTWTDMLTTEKEDATSTTPYNVLKAKLTISKDVNTLYQFRAISNSQNISQASPSIRIKVSKIDTQFELKGDTTTIKTSDRITFERISGVCDISLVEVKKDNGEWINISSSYLDGYLINENGTYTYRIKTIFNDIITESIVYENIDTAKPVISIDSNNYIEDSWENKNDIKLSVSNATKNIGTTKIQYKVADQQWKDYENPIVISNDCVATTYSFKAISEAGVESDIANFVVKRDTVKPGGDIQFNRSNVKQLINNISFGTLFKDSVDVSISGEDSLSGISKIQYYKSNQILDLEGLNTIDNWVSYTEFSLTPTDQEKVVIYVKVTDNANNTFIFGSNGFEFDVTVPDIAGVVDKKTYYTTQEVNVSDKNLDYIMLNNQKVKGTVVLEGNKDINYKIFAIDKIGNESIVEVTMKPISEITKSIDSLKTNNILTTDKEKVESVQEALESLDITKATDSEKELLKNIEDNCNNLITTIDKTEEMFKSVTDTIGKLDIDSIKSSDENTLKEIINEINQMKDTLSLTDEEKQKLNEFLEEANSLNKKIESSYNAANPSSLEVVKNIDNKNVELSSKKSLQDAKTDLEEALEKYKDNYNQSELESLQKQLDQINSALKVIENVEKSTEIIDKLPSSDKVTLEHEEDIKDSWLFYKNMSDHEKALLTKDTETKILTVSTELANKLLIDEELGVDVNASQGTYLDPFMELIVTKVEDAKVDSQAIVATNNQEFVNLYDIKLLLDGAAIQPNGFIRISLTLTNEQIQNYKNLQIVYLDNEGNITIIPHNRKGDKILFETNHLSYYGVVGNVVTKDEFIKTNDDTQIEGFLLLMGASFVIGIYQFVMQRKKESYKD